MITDLNEILVEWAYRTNDGKPDVKSNANLLTLEGVLKDFGWSREARAELLNTLMTEDDIVTKIGGSGSPYTVKNFNKEKHKLVKKNASDDEIAKVTKGKVDKEKSKDSDEKKLTGVSQESIDAIDGDAKNKTMSGDEPPPGTESSAVAEIGVGYAMGCIADNKDMDSAEKCLEGKLLKSKLGKKHGTGNSKRATRRGMLEAAVRENQKVREINEELGWKNSKTSHIGGSKSSLESTVKNLKDSGVKEVNGIPIDEYEKIILGGGAGENPTDTMVVIVNEESGEAIMYHTSNKMTSADQIANGSPAKEIREVVGLADFNEDERKQAEQAGEETRKNIGKHRGDQKRYIQEQQKKMIEDSEDSEIAKRAVDRIRSRENPISDAADGDKYWKFLTGHPVMKKYIKEKEYNLNNLSSEEEVDIYQQYVKEMKNITDMENPPESRRQGGMGDADIQLITRLYGVVKGNPQETITTNKDARDPVFDDTEMKSFYDKQTEEMNSLREKMNKIKEGSGDKAFADRMSKRLHLDMAEGHNPGGIPNNRAETIMGVYDYKDLQTDEDGNMVQKKGSKYFKLDENGKLTDEEVDKSKIKDFDCAIVADKDTMSKCLGVEENDKVTDGIGIRMGEYEGTKAIIYDRNNNQIGVQTARSKTGPGGAMQDSISYHKDFQRCLAKQTKIQGKCG